MQFEMSVRVVSSEGFWAATLVILSCCLVTAITTTVAAILASVVQASKQYPPPCLQNHFVLRQIGPPPPATSSAGLHLQYAMLLRTRSRSHHVDGLTALIDRASMMIVQVRQT